MSSTGRAEIRLPDAEDGVRRRAFGFNHDNTCSAVAVGLALSYLADARGLPLVPADRRAERLGPSVPRDAAALPGLYPNAHRLHRVLADECGLGAASCAWRLGRALRRYCRRRVPPECGLKLRWTPLPRAAEIRRNLERGLPVLITTFFAGEYSWHTMLVYGCRGTSHGTELLVHAGWYDGAHILPDAAGCREAEVWLPARLAVMGYFFSLRDVPEP